jgi:hypothetical protein
MGGHSLELSQCRDELVVLEGLLADCAALRVADFGLQSDLHALGPYIAGAVHFEDPDGLSSRLACLASQNTPLIDDLEKACRRRMDALRSDISYYTALEQAEQQRADAAARAAAQAGRR